MAAVTVRWLQHATWQGVNYRPGDTGTVDSSDLERLTSSGYAVLASAPIPPVTYPDPLPQYALDTELPQAIAAAVGQAYLPRIQPSAVTYDSQDRPLTETIPLTSGSLTKTYLYNGAGDPLTCTWDFPGEAQDYLETFTYDTAGRPTGSTFTGA